MHAFRLSDFHALKVPYSWLLVVGESGLFVVCIALLVAYFTR
jgi:hypothetical protein